MEAGIGLIDVGLAELLRRTDDPGRRRGLAAGVRLALRRTELRDDRLDRAVEAVSIGHLGDCPESVAVRALVEQLDEAAWDLQARIEAGTATQEEYLRTFAKARAAAAVGFSFESDALVAALEGLYEAHHAIQDLPALHAVVVAAVAQ